MARPEQPQYTPNYDIAFSHFQNSMKGIPLLIADHSVKESQDKKRLELQELSEGLLIENDSVKKEMMTAREQQAQLDTAEVVMPIIVNEINLGFTTLNRKNLIPVFTAPKVDSVLPPVIAIPPLPTIKPSATPVFVAD